MPTTKARKVRVKNDFYPTPSLLVKRFLTDKHYLLGSDDTVLDPCCGDKLFSRVIVETHPGQLVFDTDINGTYPGRDSHKAGDYPLDATTKEYWEEWGDADVVITNPPFNIATPIIRHALEYANKRVIMLLRMSYLEPCGTKSFYRRDILDKLTSVTVVNPRPRFRTDTKNSDSSTVGFFVWSKQADTSKPVEVDFLVDWNK